MSLPTHPYDTAEFLDDDEAIAAYAEAVIEDGDPQLYPQALDTIARASGFLLLARAAGMTRAELSDALRMPSEAKAIRAMRAALASIIDSTGRHAAE